MRRAGRIIATASLIALPWVPVAWGAVESEQGGRVLPETGRDASMTPQGYRVPADLQQTLKPLDSHPLLNKTVKNLQGDELGTIALILGDKGKPVYAEMAIKDTQQRVPVPISYLKESQSGLLLNATREQLQNNAGDFSGRTKSQDFEHMGGEPLKPETRQGGGGG